MGLCATGQMGHISGRPVHLLWGLPQLAIQVKVETSMPSTAPSEALDDVALLAQLLVRDTASFALLYDRHAPTAFGYAYHLLQDPARAEIVLEAVFLELWHLGIEPKQTSIRVWLLRRVLQHARGTCAVVHERVRPSPDYAPLKYSFELSRPSGRLRVMPATTHLYGAA